MLYTPISRRHFLKATGLSAAGATLVSIQGCTQDSSQTKLELFLSLNNGRLTFVLPRSEMGQDITTTFATLIAEELEAPLENIEVVLADASADIPNQMTVGSSSVRSWWKTMRQIGANTRALLLDHAAKLSSEPLSKLYIENGVVLSRKTDIQYRFEDLIQDLNIPTHSNNAPLKSASDFSLIGHSQTSLFNQNKINGTFNYQGDQTRDMTTVSIAYKKGWIRPEQHTLEEIKTRFQLSHVFDMNEDIGGFEYRIFLAHTKIWPLLQAKKELESAKHKSVRQDTTLHKSEFEIEVEQPDTKPKVSAKHIALSFETPAIAHTPMEPPCASIQFSSNGIEVWAPTQAPDKAKAAIAKRVNTDENRITLHTITMGGAFGRKRYSDYLEELALAADFLFGQSISAKMTLLWTREDDLEREHYRPATLQIFRWHEDHVKLDVHEGFRGAKKGEPRPIQTDLPLEVDIKASKHVLDHHFTSGIWRSVHHGYHAFALCSGIDEMCRQNEIDTASYYLNTAKTGSLKSRLKNIAGGQDDLSTRITKVVELVQKMSNPKQGTDKQTGNGFAAYSVFGSHIALIAEVSIQKNQHIKVTHIWAAVDCGLAINPDKVKAQIEGGILYGLSACLYSDIPNDKDKLALNFDAAPVLRMPDSPTINIEIIDSPKAPTGVGELGVPVIAPAVCNAIRSLSPYRFTKLPLIKEGKINYDNAINVFKT